jgi:hypothetical protein
VLGAVLARQVGRALAEGRALFLRLRALCEEDPFTREDSGRGELVQCDRRRGHLHSRRSGGGALGAANLLRGSSAAGMQRLLLLKERKYHREEQRIGRDALARLWVDGHVLAHVARQHVRRATAADALRHHFVLLLFRERCEAHMEELLRKALLVDARWPRRQEHDVSLWSEHLGHVLLDGVARCAALVEAVDE